MTWSDIIKHNQPPGFTVTRPRFNRVSIFMERLKHRGSFLLWLTSTYMRMTMHMNEIILPHYCRDSCLNNRVIKNFPELGNHGNDIVMRVEIIPHRLKYSIHLGVNISVKVFWQIWFHNRKAAFHKSFNFIAWYFGIQYVVRYAGFYSYPYYKG